MGVFGKKKTEEEAKPVSSPHNTELENKLLLAIDNSQLYAEGGKRKEIETDWSDEYLLYIGKQWDTTKGVRTKDGKKKNFNSVENYIFSTIQNMFASFAEAPVPDITGEEESDDPAGKVLTDLVMNIFRRNEFPEQYGKIALQMIQYGPVIGYVPWDQHWIGGTGPDRWVGEVRTLFQKKSEFFPDPAILDLEERLQECSYINLKQRKKLDWFAEVWPKKGKFVIEDALNIPKGQEDEGQDPQQATLITHFHKGVPKFIPEEWKQIFLDKAAEAEAEGKPYKARDLRDMAAGTLKGVHCAYKAGTILLDYVPYIYDDGLYPFVYKVLYADELQPWGMGEERNIAMPQIMRNRADEYELAMFGQGLGGGDYNKGAMSEAQKAERLGTIAKANAWNEVNDINGIRPRPTVQVPATIPLYKDGKRDAIDKISRNTAILQGQSIGANTPLGVIRELGARADAGTVYKAKVLERFMIPFVKLIINRILQFYTEDRKYRILGDDKASIEKAIVEGVTRIANMPMGTPPEQQIQAMIELLMFAKQQTQNTRRPRTAKFNRRLLVRTWDRETTVDGTALVEEFFPEFDVNVKIIKEVPTDRNYYITFATELLGKAMGPHSFWKTVETGKFPPAGEILAELDEMQKAQAQAAMQAVQAQAQAEAQENQADRQAGLLKQVLTNESQIKMTAMAAHAKAGAKNG